MYPTFLGGFKLLSLSLQPVTIVAFLKGLPLPPVDGVLLEGPGHQDYRRLSLYETQLQCGLSQLMELFMGYFLSTPTSRFPGCLLQVIKNTLVHVASNHLF